MSEKKKVLLVAGMEQNIDQIIKENINLNPENILILQSYHPVISPFGDLMRDILIAVYQENVTEIVVAFTKSTPKNAEVILKRMDENIELQGKIRTFDYLFKNCKPEFSEGSIKEWLAGGKNSSESIKNSINIIRHHPLTPSSVKVRELIIETPNKEQSELAVF